MSCERYKEALTQAAGSETPLPSAVRGHLDACAHCQGLVEREHLLLATIDAGLRRRMTADVPPSLLPGLRARFTQETAGQRERVPVWVPIAAFAALVFGIAILQSIRHARQGLDGE